MTEEGQKEVVLRAVEAAIRIRRDGHRYPECVTLDEVAAIIPEVNRSAIVRHLNQLAAEDELTIRPALNQPTYYRHEQETKV